MAVYVVSDLHGCKDEFATLLNLIHFTDYDEMYIIGDIGDRGKYPISLFQMVMKTKNFHLITGNHDAWFTHYIPGLIMEKRMPGSLKMNDDLFLWAHRNGGMVTLDQFLDLSLPECYDMQVFLEKQTYYKQLQINGRKFLLTHAGFKEHCFAGIQPAEVPAEELMWAHIGLDDNPFPDTWLVVGHTPTFCYGREYDSQIIRREHAKVLHIDCGCVYGRALGCVRLDDMQEFYVPSTYPYMLTD